VDFFLFWRVLSGQAFRTRFFSADFIVSISNYLKYFYYLDEILKRDQHKKELKQTLQSFTQAHL